MQVERPSVRHMLKKLAHWYYFSYYIKKILILTLLTENAKIEVGMQE